MTNNLKYLLEIFTYVYTYIHLQNSTLRNVPLHAAGWEHDFAIPRQYSESTMMGIAKKKSQMPTEMKLSKKFAQG